MAKIWNGHISPVNMDHMARLPLQYPTPHNLKILQVNYRNILIFATMVIITSVTTHNSFATAADGCDDDIGPSGGFWGISLAKNQGFWFHSKGGNGLATRKTWILDHSTSFQSPSFHPWLHGCEDDFGPSGGFWGLFFAKNQ
jgi:hypothetical protein